MTLNGFLKAFAYIVSFCLLLISCDRSKDSNELSKINKGLKLEIEKLQEKLNSARDYSGEVTLAGTELRVLRSSVNDQKYQIKIKLPREYHEYPSVKYLVLYVTDAETNFRGVTYITQRLIKDGLIPPLIVVGIAYGTDYKSFYELRSRDLTPVEDTTLVMGYASSPDPTGGAGLFARFLNEELFPYIELNYRVDSRERALYGHSYGGLFGAYVFLNHTELFNRYLLLSPSLWYFDNLMLKEVDTASINTSYVHLYMASGDLEGRIDELQEKFAFKLGERALPQINLKSEVIPNETHRTIFGTGFTNGLRYLYQ